MKRIIFLLIACMTMAFGYAQDDKSERVPPSYNTEIVRQCYKMNIDRIPIYDVHVILKSKSSGYSLKDKVKITILDKHGNKIYKKTFKDCHLYIFSDGQIEVGKPRFIKVLITKEDAGWWGIIRAWEGIW